MADSRVITTEHARPKLGGSPQAKWQRKKQAQGKCRSCGKDRPPELKQLCRSCQDKFNRYIRDYRKARRDKLQKVDSVPALVSQQEPSGGPPAEGTAASGVLQESTDEGKGES